MADIFVSSAGPKGMGNGIDEANATNLATALASAQPGDYVWLKNDGVYYGTFVVGCSGLYAENLHIYFIGYNSVENSDIVNHISDMDFGRPYWGGPMNPNSPNCWVNLNANGAADNVVYQYQKHNIHWRNIHFSNTNKVSGACAYYSRYSYGISFTKCKFTDSYLNLWIDTSSLNNMIRYCYFSDYAIANMDVSSGSSLTFITNSVFNGGQLKLLRSICFNNIFIGGSYAVGAYAYQNIVFNNTMYNQTEHCIGYGHTAYIGSLIEYNNIFVPASKNVLTVYKAGNGSLSFSAYGCAYCLADNSVLDTPYAGQQGLNVNPRLANPAGSDFRVLNPAVVRGGMPDYMDRPTQIGAGVQVHQFPRRSTTTNIGRLSVVR